MRKRILPLLLALLMLLTLPQMNAEEIYDGLVGQPAESPDGELTVESLIAACKEPELAAKTELMLALHDYFLSEMTISICEMELDAAKSDLDKLKKDQLMGLADALAVSAAQMQADTAQAEYDKALLEQLKAVTIVRGYTDIDITGQNLSAEDAYLTLQPSQISLEGMKSAAAATLAPTDDSTVALIEMEQSYIDITLCYAHIGTAAAAYRTASAAREEMAMAVVMGNVDAQTFRAATMNMKQTRLELFRAISDYSKLLYRINETCGGLMVRTAGKLTSVLDG